ncbi:unnamed protein product [Effrenium voratum]|nr:unnamed protein product [Effrenium voratum]
MGVLRKSLANGVVLQTIGPTKGFLEATFPQLQENKVGLSFVAGSLTGSFAEVITNPPDQVKTMTQAGKPFLEAVVLAAKHPFRGAGFAGLRKGIIRGINWGGLALFMRAFEWMYRTYYHKPQRVASQDFEVSAFVREVSEQAEG